MVDCELRGEGFKAQSEHPLHIWTHICLVQLLLHYLVHLLAKLLLLDSTFGKTLGTLLGSTFSKTLGTLLSSTFGKTLCTPLHMWIRHAPNPTSESDTWALQQFFKKTSGWCPQNICVMNVQLEINTNVSIMVKMWFPKCHLIRNRWGVEAIYGAIMVAKLIISRT